MTYNFVLFDAHGKITDVKTFPPGSQRTPGEYAHYIGLDVQLAATVFRGSGRFSGTRGQIAVVLGPYATERGAMDAAACIKAYVMALSAWRVTAERAGEN